MLSQARFEIVGVSGVIRPIGAAQDVNPEGHVDIVRPAILGIPFALVCQMRSNGVAPHMPFDKLRANGNRDRAHHERHPSARPFDKLRANGNRGNAHHERHPSARPFDRLRANGNRGNAHHERHPSARPFDRLRANGNPSTHTPRNAGGAGPWEPAPPRAWSCLGGLPSDAPADCH